MNLAAAAFATNTPHITHHLANRFPPPNPNLVNLNQTPTANSRKKHHGRKLTHSTKPIDPTVAWTSSIARHCRNGALPQAVAEFTRMRMAGVEPNHITFLTLLSGYAEFTSQAPLFGASVHGYVSKLRLDLENVMVGTALVGMYSKSGRLDLARLVFDKMRVKNSVSWNTMIDGHMRIGRIEDAVILFDQIPQRDAITWTVLIGGFVKRGHYEQALEWFREMQLSKVEPDYVTVISVLAACANVGALTLGLWLNAFLLRSNFKDNLRINNSLIDMYARCGCIELARQVFNQMSTRSIVSWNSMIVGFAINGYAEEALEFFDKMQKEGFVQNEVSFTGALTACSHAGLVDKGLWYFDIMKRTYRISPRIEHYGCMVDLYCRAGRLEDALEVIKSMPVKPNEVVLCTLLAACRSCVDVWLADKLMSYLVEIDPGVDSNYVLLSNLYSAVGRWDVASKVRYTMKAVGVQKTPGLSSIEVDGCTHEFAAGDKSHDSTEQIYAALQHLSLELGICGFASDSFVCEDMIEIRV